MTIIFPVLAETFIFFFFFLNYHDYIAQNVLNYFSLNLSSKYIFWALDNDLKY